MVSHESVEAGWKFDTEEVSAGVYRVFGNDRWGRNIERTGADPDLLLAQCKREALQIASPGTESLDSGSAAVTEERVVFSGNTVEVGGGQLRLDFPVRDAFRSADRLIVLFDPDMRPRGSKNLVCLDLSRKRLWEAEFPEPGKPDYYYEIGSRQPLVAYSLSSYDVELDPETGAILSKEFTK